MEYLKRYGWILALLLPALALKGGGLRAGLEQLPQEEATRVERFVLTWPADSDHPAQEWKTSAVLEEAKKARQLGLVELRRTTLEGSPQLELDASFPFERIRVLAVECLNPRSPRLVWREVSGGAGRTVFAEWTAESEELRVMEWGIDGRLRERSTTSGGAVMPHYLLELVRAGSVTTGTFEVFDPLGHSLESWSLSTTYQRAEATGLEYARQAEFHRADGTLAGRYLFHGTELIRFQWQAGGAIATRISEEEHAKLSEQWAWDEQQQEAEQEETRVGVVRVLGG